MMVRVILVAFAVATIWTGVAFCGVALYFLFSTVVSAAAAAALTACTSFLVAGAGMTIYLAFGRSTSNPMPPVMQTAVSQDPLVSALAQLATHSPLIAVSCAAALGLSDALNRKGK